MTDRDDGIEPVGDDFWAPEEDRATDGDAASGVAEVDSTDEPAVLDADADADADSDGTDSDQRDEGDPSAVEGEEVDEPDADESVDAIEAPELATDEAVDADDDTEELDSDEEDVELEEAESDEIDDEVEEVDLEEEDVRPRLDDFSRWLLGVSFLLIVVLLVTTGAMLYYLTTLNHAPRTAVEREVVTWETAVAERPGDAQAWGQLAYAYAAAERWSEALDTVSRGIETTDQKALIVVQADILRFAGRFAESKAAYDRAEKEIKALVQQIKKEQEKKGVYVELPDQSLTGVYFGRSLALHEMGDLDGAIADAEKAVSIAPEQASLSVTLGEYYLEAGDKDKARKMFTEALKYVPDYAEALDGLERAGGAN